MPTLLMGATRLPGAQCERFFQNRRPASDILVDHLEGSGGVWGGHAHPPRAGVTRWCEPLGESGGPHTAPLAAQCFSSFWLVSPFLVLGMKRNDILQPPELVALSPLSWPLCGVDSVQDSFNGRDSQVTVTWASPQGPPQPLAGARKPHSCLH